MADAALPKRSLIWRLWGGIMFLLVAGALASSAYLYRRLQREEAARAALAADVAAFGPRFEQFKGAVRDVGKKLSTTVFQEVDLGTAGWQPIAGGFYVIDLSVVAVGKGTRISGKIVNPTSVVHENAQFSARIDEHRGTFALTRVLRSLLFDVSTTDPRFFVAAAVLVAVVALAATYVPARRVLQVDATAALRDAT